MLVDDHKAVSDISQQPVMEQHTEDEEEQTVTKVRRHLAVATTIGNTFGIKDVSPMALQPILKASRNTSRAKKYFDPNIFKLDNYETYIQ